MLILETLPGITPHPEALNSLGFFARFSLQFLYLYKWLRRELFLGLVKFLKGNWQ